MGLDTTHGCWHGSYGSFNTFRKWVCKEVLGLELDTRIGHGGAEPWPDHPIVSLLDHSDCDGDLDPDECLKIGCVLLPLYQKHKYNPCPNPDRWVIEGCRTFGLGCIDAWRMGDHVHFH